MTIVLAGAGDADRAGIAAAAAEAADRHAERDAPVPIVIADAAGEAAVAAAAADRLREDRVRAEALRLDAAAVVRR